MAEAASAQTDRDLTSIAEARALARRAKQAWLELAEFSQEKIDAIIDAMAAAATPQAEAFARLAVAYPFGDNVKHKTSCTTFFRVMIAVTFAALATTAQALTRPCTPSARTV